jgi:ribonuclease BN (tRNA processing enzyme)
MKAARERVVGNGRRARAVPRQWGLSVTAFPVLHYTPEATALRVTVGGKTIAYSGDTGWTETLLEVAADADLFICGTYTIDVPQRGLLNYRTLQDAGRVS